MKAFLSFFTLPSATMLREIAGAFNDANNAIRVEAELNGGKEITREGC